tara:strand:- start:914 stop:1126 length:213 start_codon:yes stop_codon:yes gene_type:complete
MFFKKILTVEESHSFNFRKRRGRKQLSSLVKRYLNEYDENPSSCCRGSIIFGWDITSVYCFIFLIDIIYK